MQADRRGVEAGREQARAVSSTLTRAALVLVVLAALLSLAFWRLISRPILAAVAEIRDAAIAIGQGGAQPAPCRCAAATSSGFSPSSSIG